MYERFGFGTLDNGKRGLQLFIPGKGDGPSQYTRGGDSHIVRVQVAGEDLQKKLGLQTDAAAAPVMTEAAHAQGRLFTYALPDDFPDGYYQYKYIVEFANTERRMIGDPCTK